MACIPFAELLPGHKIKVTSDSPPLIWAVDLVMAVTGLNQSDAGQAIRRLVEGKLFPEDKILVKSQVCPSSSEHRPGFVLQLEGQNHH